MRPGLNILPVILCGGAGARLWPASTPDCPKPFLRPDGGDSLLQQAVRRAVTIEGVSEIVIVTSGEFRERTLREAQAVAGDCAVSCLVEPAGRDTGPAIAAVCLWAAERDAGATLLVLPADHVINDLNAFAVAVARATALAATGKIVTFGIRPDRPETGYGYIEAEGETVARFVEKPDRATAERYLATGCYLWNAGMFCFRAEIMLAEMEHVCPDLLVVVRNSFVPGHRDGVLGEGFAAAPRISIDRAVMEKTRNLAVVPCAIGWSDIGCWNALGDLTLADDAGNTVRGQTVLRDVAGCHVFAGDRVIGLLGVRDLIVVDTPDGLLIAHKDRAQDVRDIYAACASRKPVE